MTNLYISTFYHGRQCKNVFARLSRRSCHHQKVIWISYPLISQLTYVYPSPTGQTITEKYYIRPQNEST